MSIMEQRGSRQSWAIRNVLILAVLVTVAGCEFFQTLFQTAGPNVEARVPFNAAGGGSLGDVTAIIDGQAAFLNQAADVSVVIEGYAVGTQTDEYLLAYSERTAASVRDALVARGVAASRITVRGNGRNGATRCNELDTPAVDACTLTVAEDRGTTSPQGLMLIGATTTYWVPADALNSSTVVALRERIDRKGGVSLSPAIQFNAEAFLFFDGTTQTIAKLDTEPAAVVPQALVPGGTLAILSSQSEWGTGGTITDCESGVTHCGKTHWTGPALFQPACVAEATESFDLWLQDVAGVAYDEAGTLLAGIKPACGLPDSLFSQLTANPTGNTYPCVGRSGLCRDWVVNIPAHNPVVNSTIYLPDPGYLASATHCGGAQTTVDNFYQALLDHELAHHNAFQLATSAAYAGTVTVQNVPIVVTERTVKAKGYQKGCLQHLRGESAMDHQTIDADPTDEMTILPAMCRDCGNTCMQRYDCPCNSIVYDDLSACLSACQVNLGCFTGICAQLPVDPTCPP